MRSVSSFLLTGTCLLVASCQRPASQPSSGTDAACIDPARIDPTGICTMEYAPVCGCNGQTYANPCLARQAGLLAFTAGPCPTRTGQ